MKRDESTFTKRSGSTFEGKNSRENSLSRSIQHSLSNILQVADNNSRGVDVEQGIHQYNYHGRRLKSKRKRNAHLNLTSKRGQPGNHTKSLMMKRNSSFERRSSKAHSNRDTDSCTDIVILPDTNGQSRNTRNVRAFHTTNSVTFSQESTLKVPEEPIFTKAVMQFNEESPYPVTVANDEEFKAVKTIFANHYNYYCPERVVSPHLKPPKHIKQRENYDKKFMVMSVSNKQE